MLTHKVDNAFADLQDQMYTEFNKFSSHHPIVGRLLALPVALVDVILDTVKYPLAAIEHLAMAVFNLLASCFSPNYTPKDAISHLELAFHKVLDIPGTVAVLPLKLIYQTLAVFYLPDCANSIRADKWSFKGFEPIEAL